MAEYIERSAGVSIFRAKANMAVLMDAAPYFEKAAQMLEKLPTADVAPVRHGHWIENGDCQICSECGEEHCWDEYRAAYCDSCGAKMDGKDSEEND